MLDDIDELRTFVTIVAACSLSATARKGLGAVGTLLVACPSLTEQEMDLNERAQRTRLALTG